MADVSKPAPSLTTRSSAETLAPWRLRSIGLLRIAFGVVWLVDAAFKWSPEFLGKFADSLSGALKDQPPAAKAWIQFWINVVHVDPHVFAHIVVFSEALLALGLLFGIFSNLTNFSGILLSFAIWSTAEGFGGPYTFESVDIGAAIIYVFVFAGLYFANAGRDVGIDRWLTPRLGCFGFLASPKS